MATRCVRVLRCLDDACGIGQRVNVSVCPVGQLIYILGTNFGPPEMTTYLEAVSYGGSLYFPTNCKVVTYEKISCLTVPGIGFNLRWQVRLHLSWGHSKQHLE